MHERVGSLPRQVREAIASEGLSEVERVAVMEDPPTVVTCATARHGAHGSRRLAYATPRATSSAKPACFSGSVLGAMRRIQQADLTEP
jgi:hypothetical protein